jgi:hypothetical protein
LPGIAAQQQAAAVRLRDPASVWNQYEMPLETAHANRQLKDDEHML